MKKMEKKLIIEISRNRQLMGILNETGPGLPLLGREVGEFLTKKFATKAEGQLLQDIEELSSILSRKKTTSTNDLVELMTRLIRSNKEIADYLVPKIIQNLDTGSKNFIARFKQGIENYKKIGGAYEDAIKNINTNLNATRNGRPVFDTPIPEVKEYLKKDLEKYAWAIYNPIKSKAVNVGGDVAKGFKQGWGSKSGGFLTLRSIKNAITPQKIEKLFPKYFKKLTPEERDVMWKWVKWGVPDLPSLKSSWGKLGFAGAFGNASAQLLSKTLWLMSLLTFFQFIRDYVEDIYHEGDEYAGWNKLMVFLHRIYRAFDVPHLGVTSPMAWLIGLIIQPIWAGMRGSSESLKQEVINYIVGEDENNIPKPPKKVKEYIKDFISNTDTLINKTKSRIDTLSSGTNVNTDDIIPDTITIPKTDNKLDVTPKDSTKISQDW